MIRRAYIEQIQRLIYGGFVQNDAEITINLINQWLDQGIAYAAQKNYLDNLKIDSIAYVNNSFYITYKDLEITKEEQFLWKIQLPHIPFGLGNSEGISTVELKNSKNRLSYPVVMLSMNQRSFARGMRTIPNKLPGYSEGENVFIESTLILSEYLAQVVMVSGGNSNDLDSTLNVPADYIIPITEYLKNNLMFERMAPVDDTSDGIDAVGIDIKP